MQRRDFIKVIAGWATAWPLAAHAQQSSKLPIVAFLGATTPNSWAPQVDSFTQRLRELGWADGETVSIVYRWAEGKIDRYDAFAAELVQLKVNVIVTVGSAIPAVKRATSTIPIVFAAAVDPLGSGFVASLARPGGNVTGLSLQSSDMASKRIALLHQIVPGLSKIVIMADPGYPAALREAVEVATAAQQLGISSETLQIRAPGDFASAINGLREKRERYTFAPTLL